jgi:hypothetical protein
MKIQSGDIGAHQSASGREARGVIDQEGIPDATDCGTWDRPGQARLARGERLFGRRDWAASARSPSAASNEGS